MDKDSAIIKIKGLLKLSASVNTGAEAETSLNLAKKLMEKYNITSEEVEEKVINYEDEKFLLFTSKEEIYWKSKLAMDVANKVYCYVIQNKLIAGTGEEQYVYYIYGEYEDDVNKAVALFKNIETQIEKLIENKAKYKKGPVYMESYLLGIMTCVSSMLQAYEFEISNLNKTEVKKQEIKEEIKKEEGLVSMVNASFPKDAPVKEKTFIKGTHIKDILAYFNGLSDGEKIKIDKDDLLNKL